MDASTWRNREDAEAFWQAYACDNPFGDSILHIAVRGDDLDLTRRLLEGDFPVDQKNDLGETPLHVAARLDLPGISQLLVCHGADVFERKSLPRSISRDDNSMSDAEVESGDIDVTPGPQLLASGQKSVSAFDIAFDGGHDSLLKVFIKQSLPVSIDASRESKMLLSMAKAFVENRKGVLEAFHEIGWDLKRQHSVTKRSLFHHVAEMAVDVGPVNVLLGFEADATAEDLGGATILHAAAQLGRCSDGSVVKRLIAAGARVAAKDRIFGGTPLLAAIQGGKIANVRVLLEADADVNHIVKPDNQRRTLLHIAAQDGIPEITQLLLDFGANPNVLDEMGGTPAQWAVRNNHVEVIRVLLEGGLDPNLDKGHSLRLALSLGRLRIARLFFRHGAKVDESIIYAAKESSNYKGNRIPFFKLCAENMNSDEEAGSTEDSVTIGGDVQVSIRLTGLTLPTLMNGIEGRSDDFRLAAVLFEYGLEKGLRDLEDIPRALLICICAEYGFERGISRLLELGNISTAIRRHSVRPFKWTALHVAIWFGHTALVEILHANGWSLTQEDSKGRSIVELAASQGHVELVQKLLAAHCSAEHRDQDGHTPLHFAVSGPGGDNALLLECLHVAGCNVRKASVSGETALHQAAQLNHSTAAAWLLGKGALVGATDRFSNTPLHFAAYYNAVRVVEILLSYNADVNQTAVDGRTPLHCASQAGADDAIPALLGAGADPNKTDSKGRTALTTAIFFSACEPSTVDTLFACTTVDWMAKRGAQPVVTAALAARSENRAAILANVLYTLRKAMGEAKAQRIVQRLMPELVPEMLVSADDSDRGSLTDLIPLLLEFLPKNARTRNVMLFHMLLAAIKYGGDDDGHLTRQLLLLDESNVTQVSRGNWGLQHLCCKYGRLKQLRVFLAFGLSPYSRVDIDGVSHQPLDVAKMFSPEMVGPLETLIKNMSILGNLCRSDRTISPLLRSAVGMAHSEREIVDLSVAFKQDVITHRQ